MPAASRSTHRVPGSFGPRAGLLIALLLLLAMVAAAWGVRLQLDTLERLRGQRQGLAALAELQALSAVLAESRSEREIESAWSRAVLASSAWPPLHSSVRTAAAERERRPQAARRLHGEAARASGLLNEREPATRALALAWVQHLPSLGEILSAPPAEPGRSAALRAEMAAVREALQSLLDLETAARVAIDVPLMELRSSVDELVAVLDREPLADARESWSAAVANAARRSHNAHQRLASSCRLALDALLAQRARSEQQRLSVAAAAVMLLGAGLVLLVMRLRPAPRRAAPGPLPPALAEQAQQMRAALDGIEQSMRRAGEIAAQLADRDAGRGAAPAAAAAREPPGRSERSVK